MLYTYRGTMIKQHVYRSEEIVFRSFYNRPFGAGQIPFSVYTPACSKKTTIQPKNGKVCLVIPPLPTRDPERSEGSLAGKGLFKCSRGVPRYHPRAYGSGSGPYCPLASMSVPDHMRSKMSTAAACETMFGWQRSSMRYGAKRMLTSVVPRQ